MVKIFCSNCGKPIFVPDGKTSVFCTECGTKLTVPAAPAAETPKVETPVEEAPKVEASVVETPVAEAPRAEAPVVEALKAEAPVVEAPKVETPVVEAPKAEAPRFEAPKPAPAPQPSPVAVATAAPAATAPAEEKPKKKKGLLIGIIAGAAVLLLAAAAAVFMFLIKPGMDYTAAQKLLEDKSYDEAIAAFEKLGNYKDSQAKADEARLEKAIKLVSSGKFDKAVKELKEIEDDDIDLSKLNEALGDEIAKLASEGDVDGVLDAIDAMGDYVDNADEAVAAGVSALIQNQEYYSAYSLIADLSSDDAIEDMSVVRAAVTKEFQALVDADNFDEATSMYYSLADYIDDISGIAYKKISEAIEAGKYDSARSLVEYIYWSVPEPAKAVADKANALIEAGELDEAILVAGIVEDYSEYRPIIYSIADKYFENEDYEKAATLFDSISWYEDASDRAKAARSKVALDLIDKEGMTAEEYAEVYDAVRDAGAEQSVIDAFIVKWAKDALEDADTELASKLYYSVYLPDSAEADVYAVVLENLPKTATVDSNGVLTSNEDEITAIKSVLDLFGYYYESVPQIKDYLTCLSAGKSFSNDDVTTLWDVSGMKDILTSELGLSGAIVGNWESDDGEYGIEMTERGNGTFNFNYELPAGDLPENTRSWYIGGHDLILTDENGEDIQSFVKITVTDLDHITVYCYNTDTTVELTKES